LTINRLLVLAALVIAAVLAVLLLVTSSEIALLTAVGWAFVVAALYLGSLLVP
jgi:hypothetical protein